MADGRDIPGRFSPQISHVVPRIGLMQETHCGHTGKREIFSKGVPQIRQSEGKRAANKPWATVAAPAFAKFTRLRPAGSPERPNLGFGIGGTVVRIVSPVLLKTDLPRPAPG